jgi:hypothetical protein
VWLDGNPSSSFDRFAKFLSSSSKNSTKNYVSSWMDASQSTSCYSSLLGLVPIMGDFGKNFPNWSLGWGMYSKDIEKQAKMQSNLSHLYFSWYMDEMHAI